MSRILIVGATGTVGTELTHLLAAAGHDVVAATRRPDAQPAQPGVTWVALDLASGEGLDAAFTGVQRAFLLSPPGHADQFAVLNPLIAAAQRHRLEKVVLMTAQGVDADEAIPFRRAERALEASGLPYAIVRPGWFMQNFETFWIDGIRARDTIALPAADARSGFVDARDIAAVVATLIARDGTDGAFVLTGPEALTHDEVAAAIATVAGRPIRYQDADPLAFRAGLVAGGVPADYADLLVALYAGVRAGWAAGLTDDVARVLGRPPIAFARHVADHAAAYAPAPAPVGV